MKLVRPLLAFLAVAVSFVAAYRLCWMRLRCERDKYAIVQRLDYVRDADAYTKNTVAREILPRLRACVEQDPSDFQARFLMAKAATHAGQDQLALSLYQEAADLNQRPEIYASIGLLHLKAGRVNEARENLMRATMFNTHFAGYVAQPLQDELQAAVIARRERLLEEAKRAKTR